MKPDNTKNYYMALALSVLCVFVWNFFYAQPQKARQQAQIQAQNQAAHPSNAGAPAKPGAPGSLPPVTPNAPPQGGVAPDSRDARQSRAEALAAGPRVGIETPAIEGSIALRGGRLDDIRLRDYRVSISKTSPNIVLLSPPNAPDAYFAEWGFGASAGVETPGSDTQWTAEGDKLTPETPLTLRWDNGKGLVFKRKFSVDKNYMFTVSNSVENKGTAPVTLTPYALIMRQGTPKTAGYSVVHEGFIGVAGDAYQEPAYKDIEKEPGERKELSGTGGWLGFTDTYWATSLIPDQAKPFKGAFQSFGTGDKSYQTAVQGEPMQIAAGASAETTSRLFAGAKVVSLINDYWTKLHIQKFDLMIDWGYFWFITKPMFSLLDAIYKIVGNFGLAIIALTFLVKLVFFPLANRSYKSMAKMKIVQPQVAALKERFPDDKMKQQQAMMEIYKREKVNPIAGCLPMLIQIPVFFALYKVLFVTIEMRQAPFYGWIHDLSQPDPTNVFNLFGLIPYNPTTLPVIGHFLAIGILPLIMGVSMFLQMKMNPEPADPVQKAMFAWMPVIFTFMLGTFPSGLVLYWTVNNTLTILQQGVIMNRAGAKFELWDNVKSMFVKKPAAESPPASKPAPGKPAPESKAPAE